MLQTKQLIDKIFNNKSPPSDSSLASVSEIPERPDLNTISLKTSRICDILPVENINIIKQLLKTTPKDDTEYLEQLKSLCIDVITYMNLEE